MIVFDYPTGFESNDGPTAVIVFLDNSCSARLLDSQYGRAFSNRKKSIFRFDPALFGV